MEGNKIPFIKALTISTNAQNRAALFKKFVFILVLTQVALTLQ